MSRLARLLGSESPAAGAPRPRRLSRVICAPTFRLMACCAFVNFAFSAGRPPNSATSSARTMLRGTPTDMMVHQVDAMKVHQVKGHLCWNPNCVPSDTSAGSFLVPRPKRSHHICRSVGGKKLRTTPFGPSVRRIAQAGAKFFDQAGFAEPWLAHDQYQLPVAAPSALPAPHEHRYFLVAAYEWRQMALSRAASTP
jgi:hypothetical protein